MSYIGGIRRGFPGPGGGNAGEFGEALWTMGEPSTGTEVNQYFTAARNHVPTPAATRFAPLLWVSRHVFLKVKASHPAGLHRPAVLSIRNRTSAHDSSLTAAFAADGIHHPNALHAHLGLHHVGTQRSVDCDAPEVLHPTAVFQRSQSGHSSRCCIHAVLYPRLHERGAFGDRPLDFRLGLRPVPSGRRSSPVAELCSSHKPCRHSAPQTGRR